MEREKYGTQISFINNFIQLTQLTKLEILFVALV